MITVTKTPRYRITLSEEEAQKLCALLGGILSEQPSQSSWHSKLFYAMDALLPERSFSFSDLFEWTEEYGGSLRDK